MNFISGQIIQLWLKYIDIIRISPLFVSAFLRFQYESKVKDQWDNAFFTEIYKQNNFSNEWKSSLWDQRKSLATSARNTKLRKIEFKNSFEDKSMFPKYDQYPIIFEDKFLKPVSEHGEENIVLCFIIQDDNEAERDPEDFPFLSYKGIHLLVLCHGFQGNSYDMKLCKNFINFMHPEIMFLCSNINEDNTEGDINEMGERLANEVITFVSENCPGNSLGRLSFIGHSLGGIIIRSALKHLDIFSEKFHLYMSFSSPHLGYLYNSSKLIDAGMWLLKRWKKSISLQQLTMSDSKNPVDTFLYKLSQENSIGSFKKVAFFSSFQDNYAPHDSARVEISKEALNDNSQKGEAYRNMISNILNSFKSSSLFRIDVNFNIAEKNLDTFIGRTAHILFLESQTLLWMIVHRYQSFFI